MFHVSPRVPFHVSPGQVPIDSISPDAEITVGNYIGSGGQYMRIQDDIEEFAFKKELNTGKRHVQYTIRRDSICVGDLDITSGSPFRVKKQNKQEVARVNSDLGVTYSKWEADRAKQLAIVAEREAVAPFQTQTAAPAAAPAAAGAATGATGHDDDSDDS